MDYQSIYNRIIERNCTTPKIKKQTENHHIIPRSFAKLDGIDDIDGRWNRVNLPLREHFIAHLLLARIWRGHKVKGPKMARAFSYMSNNGKYTSKDYSWLKLGYKHSSATIIKMSKSQKGRKQSKEHIDKRSKAMKGKNSKPRSEETKRKISESRKGIIFSDEHKENMSKSRKGKPISESHRAKLLEVNTGRKCSEETKQKIRDSLLGRARSEETKNKIRQSHINRVK